MGSVSSTCASLQTFIATKKPNLLKISKQLSISILIHCHESSIDLIWVDDVELIAETKTDGCLDGCTQPHDLILLQICKRDVLLNTNTYTGFLEKD